MSDLPAPLTPADCDLRGFEWMAIHGHRLFTSGWYLAAMKDPRGGIAALKLWWAAMLQCPAGSLPSDEEELCLLADFGQDMKAWRKHRLVAMRGFILCQDDRYYHPVVAEQAIKAYESRLKASATRQADAERLRRWRASNGSHPPQKPNGHGPPETPDETRFRAPGNALRNATETGHETSRATRGEDSTRQERPPRNPPVGGGAARAKPSRNPFHDKAREMDAELEAQGIVIDGLPKAIVDFYEATGVRPKRIGGASG